jgi:hypothetical protein
MPAGIAHVPQPGRSHAPLHPTIPKGSDEPASGPVTLATAVFVAGTGPLEPGSRYAIALHDGKLQFLVPTDQGSPTLVLQRPVAGFEARAIEGRLLLNESQQPSGMVLAFMAVAGSGTEALADVVSQAARNAARSQ